MLALKESTPLADLCDGMPPPYAEFAARCRALRFDETPDYDALGGLLRECVGVTSGAT